MIDRYETENSVYYIDRENKQYMRRPIWEQHDSSPRLQYGVWLPLDDRPDAVEIVVEAPAYRAPELRRPCLRIYHESSTMGILTSPVIRHTQVACWDI